MRRPSRYWQFGKISHVFLKCSSYVFGITMAQKKVTTLLPNCGPFCLLLFYVYGLTLYSTSLILLPVRSTACHSHAFHVTWMQSGREGHMLRKSITFPTTSARSIPKHAFHFHCAYIVDVEGMLRNKRYPKQRYRLMGWCFKGLS